MEFVQAAHKDMEVYAACAGCAFMMHWPVDMEMSSKVSMNTVMVPPESAGYKLSRARAG